MRVLLRAQLGEQLQAVLPEILGMLGRAGGAAVITAMMPDLVY